MSGATSMAAESSAVRWVREWDDPKGICFRVGYLGDRLYAEWVGLGSLSASMDGHDADARLAAGVDSVQEERWRRGPVRALLRHLEGRTTLHASAVAMGNLGLAFLGPSGAGKSTCAAHLVRSFHGQLLADDLAHVDVVDNQYVVGPSEEHHWLFEDSRRVLGLEPTGLAKGRVVASRRAAAPCRLAALVALDFVDGPPVLQQIRGQAAFTTLNAVYVRFLIDDERAQLRDLHQISRLLASVPVYRLSRPRELSALADSASLLSNLLPPSESLP